nr:hypothetical protein CQW23_11471 [Ipomoea trifida]
MATYDSYAHSNSSQRGVAMVLAMVSAVVLSPLYTGRGKAETRWSSGGLVLPAVLVGLIVAIKTASSVQSVTRASSVFLSLDSSSVFRIGSSSWGLAGMLIMLICVLSWQSSVQHYFWT